MKINQTLSENSDANHVILNTKLADDIKEIYKL